MIEQPTRRGLITGLGAFFCAAPAIVRATSIMPVHAIEWSPVHHLLWDEFHVSEIAFWSQPPCWSPVHHLLWDEP
jgi:hypothetical protein